MRKWIRRIGLGAVALATMAVAAGLVFERWSRWRAARAFPAVGELVEVDGSRSHLLCTGTGTPTVILESGLDTYGSQAWVKVQPEIARLTRVCSYDRAGILWALLSAASESPPYVMVGHSIGGPLVRVFAQRFEDEVVGLVLVDASHPEMMKRLMKRFPPEVIEMMTAGPPPLLVKTFAALGILRLMHLGEPPDSLPGEVRDLSDAFNPTSTTGWLGEMNAAEDIMAQAGETGSLGDRPLVVLSAGQVYRPPRVSDDVSAQMVETWNALQADLASLSSNADRRVVPDATHYIQLDDPAAVIAAVSDVVSAVREGTRVARSAEGLQEGSTIE
jgi:pimeloyl-ACP methyl ester carboxylesterase